MSDKSTIVKSQVAKQVAHTLKCKNTFLHFTGHILSSPHTDTYSMEYQCDCGAYIYEIKTAMELTGYSYPTDDEHN